MRRFDGGHAAALRDACPGRPSVCCREGRETQ
jgi:hypothetical protein